MQRERRKRRVAAWLLALIMMLSLVPGGNVQVQAAGSEGTSTQARSTVTSVFGNNGYPYGKDMSASAVTLVADLAEGVDADSVQCQWSYCADKNGAYTDIAGANSLTYKVADSLLVTEKKYWYKCTVNRTASLPVQLVKANTDITIKAKSHGAKEWYVSNGYVAYTYDGNTLFNVVGYYKAKDVWIDTVFSQGWKMTAAPEKFMAAFNSKNDYGVNCTVVLANDQEQFAIDTDVCLGDKDTSTANGKDYSDDASLKAIYDKGTDKLKQIQMVGNESIDAATDTDPSFVLQFVTDPSMYWLGGFGSRTPFAYNEATNGDGVKSTKTINGTSVVTEVGGIDSGMACSWMNLSAGSTIKFNFNVGSVSDTGASIGTTTELTSKSIIYKDLTEGYEYMLQVSNDGGKTWSDVSGAEWVEPNEDNSLTYCAEQTSDNGVKDGTRVEILENTSYKLICRKKDGDSKTEDVKGGDVTTNVDPTVPDKDSSEEQGKITIDTEWNTITLGNVRSNYEYQLQDEYGEAVTEWLAGDEEKKITFSGLNEETTYYLVAKEKDKDTKSDQYPITTPEHPKLNLTYVGNFGEEEVNVPDKVEAGVPWEKEYTLSDVVPTKSTEDKYQFIGWSTKADAAEAEYQPGDKVKFDQDTTLYAIWKMPLTYTAEDVNVTYDGQPHNIKVVVTEPDNAVITYGADKDNIAGASASYTDAGTYTIWYQITAPNYQIVRESRTLTITKATPILKLENKICMTDGEKGTIDAAIVTGADGNVLEGGSITYTYYTDKACTQKTTTDNSGAESEGKEPTKKGTYFVKAVRSEDAKYKEAVSNVAKLIIAPDVYFEDENGDRQYCSFEDAFNPDVNTKQATVYVAGNTIVDSDVTVPDGFTLEISGGATLTIPEGVTFINNGSVFNDSRAVIDGSGRFENNGTVTNGKINAVVRNNGTLNHTTLGNTVTNRGKIIAPATNSDNITNEGDGTVVTSNNKAITRTITFSAKNGLSDTVAEKVPNLEAVSIPWGNRINTITLPVISNIEDTAQFEGWYMEPDCNNPAIEEKMGVNSNITLYAKWKEYGSYEAYWTDKSGEKHYGSWDEILKDMEQHPEDVDEVHIQNPVDIDEDTKLPDGAKLYVDAPNGEMQLEDGVQLEVPGGIDNDGTIKPKNDAPATKPTIKAPVDNKKQLEGVTVEGDVKNEKDAKITDATITGDLKNDGDVTDSKVDGNVTNNETGKLDDVAIPEGKLDNSGSYSEGGKTLEYAVTFMVNGKPDTVEAQTNIPYAGKAAYVRPELTEGQVFSGWYENDDYTKLWKFDQNVVVKNLTLYAKVSETAEDYVTSWKDENGDTTYGSLQDALDSGSKDIHIRKNCTMPDGTMIPEDVSVTVDDGVVVTIPKNADVKVDGDLTNNGTISNGGTLSGNGTLDNNGTVYGGIIMPDVENNGKLDGTTLNGNVSNKENGKITDSTLNGTTRNEKGGKISDSTLNGSTTNDGRIDNCTIEGKIDNQENGKIVNSDFDQVQYTVTFDNDGHGKKPEDQVIGCGAKVKAPAQMKDADYVFLGWYYNENEWKFDTDTVNRNITLKAQWKAKTSYEAYWYNEDGEKEYGSLEEAVKEPAKEEIHIQRPTDVTTDISVPNGTTLIIDENAELKVSEPGSLKAEESIINKGTLSGSPITANVDNQGIIGSTDQPTVINGDVKNTGKITDSTIKGTTTNDKTGTIENSTLEGTIANQGDIQNSNLNGTVSNEKNATITGGKVVGETTNKGSISDATLEGNIINQGILKGNEKEESTTIDNKSPDAVVSDKDGKEITYTVTFENNGYGEALQQQTVAYGKVVTKPTALLDDVYTLKGWYADVNLTNVWNFEKDVVTSDITLYAKWMPKADYEASWTEDGQTVYGSLEEAIAAGAKDIHIQKDLTIQKDMTIPEGTTVTVEDKNTVTIPEGVTVTVPAGAELINHGTIQNRSKIDGSGNITNNGTLQGGSDSTVDATVVNNGKVTNSELNGSVENNGIVKDTTLNGDVKNTGKINDCEINAGLKNDGNGKVTVDGDEVVYKDQIVKGKVTKGDNKENVDSTTITFQQGSDKKVGSGEVKDGLYQVDKLPNGYYNVVIPSEDGSKVNTFFVKVTDDEIQMKEFNLPDGNLSDQVVVKEGTPKIVVDGLAQMLTDAVDQNTAGVTSEDQRIAKNGGDVDVTFTATQIAAIPDTDVDLEKVIKEDNKSVGMNLDLSVLKTVTTTKNDDTTKTETYLKELNKPIMVHIPIPTEKQGKKGYIIYRSHTDQDGKITVDKITEEKNADGEYIEVAKNGSAITLYTKKFSTYVLAFDPDKTEEPDTPQKPDVPDTPDGKPNVPEQGNNNSTEQTTTEAPKTSEGLESLPKQQQKDAKKLMQTLGLTEAEAVEIMKFAMDNNISMDTLLVSDTTITSQKNDKDIKGSSFARIQAATGKLDKTSVKLKWNKVNGADGYLVFGNKCGKGNKYQFIKDVKGVKTNLGLKKLKKGTYYKYVVRAYKLIGDKKVTIALSKTVHATTKGGKYGVAKAVKVNKSKVNLKAGKTFTIKASEIKEDKTIRHHRDIVYESSDLAVATVDKHGVVKAVKKGSCYVYAYAQNGVYKKIKVTVK